MKLLGLKYKLKGLIFKNNIKQNKMKTENQEFPMLLTENTIWKVELNKVDEIKIQLNGVESMYINLFENTYIYYGANLKLPKYINKIVSKHLVINQ